MGLISAYLERRVRHAREKEERERRDNDNHKRHMDELDRLEKERVIWWASLTPEQKREHLRQKQLDRIESSLKEIRRQQQYDPNDYDIV